MPASAIVVSPLLPYPPTSGGQKRTLRLLEAIERAGGRPRILTADPAAAEHVAALRARGWDVETLPFAPGVRDRAAQHLRRLPSPYLTPVARRVREAPGAAFVQLEHTMSAYYRALRPGTPVVLSLHNLDSEVAAASARAHRPGTLAWARERNRALATAAQERRSFGAVDRVLCVSEHDAAAVTAQGGTPLVVPNGVDAELFAPTPVPREPLAVFFGHFGYRPNRDGLLRFLREGWPRALSAHPHARLAVAGPGLDGAARGLLAPFEHVDVLGLVDDLPALLARAAVVLVPLWEGGGTRLKALEAMAAARPVVGTPLGVERIGFADGQHGIVASQPAGLADALASLLGDPARATSMGERGRAHAERYRWDRVTAELETLYAGYLTATA